MARKIHPENRYATAAKTSEITRDDFEHAALMMIESSSRLEDTGLENRLIGLCEAALAAGDDTEIEAALSRLKDDQGRVYDHLLGAAEECAQSVVDENGAAILLLIPILAWSRYTFNHGPLDQETLVGLGQAVARHLAGPGARAVMGNAMFTPENVPEAFCQVRGLLQRLRNSEDPVVEVRDLITRPAEDVFTDSRYLVCAVLADTPQHLFRDSAESYFERARALMDFCLEAEDLLDFTMIGTVFKVQPPQAFFSAWRLTEQSLRYWGAKTLVDFVEAMGYAPGHVKASIGFFVPGAKTPPDTMSELRIALCPKDDPQRVLCGVAWAVTLDELEQSEALAQDLLISKGVHDITVHSQSFTLEWCDDCGSPLYANPDGMVVHVEPEQETGWNMFAPTLN